jgi:hypothetical protein
LFIRGSREIAVAREAEPSSAARIVLPADLDERKSSTVSTTSGGSGSGLEIRKEAVSRKFVRQSSLKSMLQQQQEEMTRYNCEAVVCFLTVAHQASFL